MKFAHQIHHVQRTAFATPAWQCAFLSYKPLKKLLLRILRECSSEPAERLRLQAMTVTVEWDDSGQIHIAPKFGGSHLQTGEQQQQQQQLRAVIAEFFEQLNADLQRMVRTYVQQYESLEQFSSENFLKEIAQYQGLRNEKENITALRQLLHFLEDFLHTLDSSESSEYHWSPRESGAAVARIVPPLPLLSLCSKPRSVFHRKATRRFAQQLPDVLRAAVLLQEYTWVNLTAFRKILKKFDKHMGSSTMKSGLESVGALPFRKRSAVVALLRRVRDAVAEPIPTLNALSCGICLDILHHPLALPCGHTFCQLCLEQAHSTGLSVCPYCRRVCRLWSERYAVDKALDGKCAFYYPEEFQRRRREDARARWGRLVAQWKADFSLVFRS